MALRYRPEKVEFVRESLRGIDRPRALTEIIEKVWDGAKDNTDRFGRLIHFVEKMMIHPPVEQPLEADACRSLRHDCCPPTDHGAPYAEDLQVPWAQKAFAEAREFGRHVGIWCSRVGQELSGDW